MAGRFLFILALFLFRALPVYSQAGKIREPDLGIELTVPEGWQYRATEEGYLLGHPNLAGLMVLTLHEYRTLDELDEAARQGLEEEGLSLQLSSTPEPFGENGRAAFFAGHMDGEKVKAYLIALLNNQGGPGLSGMLLSSSGAFGKAQQEALDNLMRSVVFSRPEKADEAQEWQDFLTIEGGCKLRYLSSVNSTQYDGGYAGGSTEEIISLCPDGSFSYFYDQFYSMDVNSSFGHASDREEGSGTWRVVGRDKESWLVLDFSDGRTREYALTSDEESKIYLNGSRFFYLIGENGPGCR